MHGSIMIIISFFALSLCAFDQVLEPLANELVACCSQAACNIGLLLLASE